MTKPLLATQVSGSGEDLILVHGWGMNSGVWTDVAEQLANEYRVTCIDLPGHGQSLVESVGTLENWVDAILSVAPEKAIWVGWSLGGLIATKIAVSHTSRVEKLVLVASSPRFLQAADWPDAMQDEVFDLFAAELERDSQSAWQRFLALQLRGTPNFKDRLRHLRALLEGRGRPVREGLQQGLEILRSTDLREEMAQIECPVIGIYGGKDTLVSESSQRQIKALLPAIEIIQLSDSGHAPFLTDLQLFVDLLQKEHSAAVV